MFDSESKRVLDKLVAKEDLQELQRENNADAYPGALSEKLIEEFYAVTSSMQSALDEKPPEQFREGLASSHEYALGALLKAKTAKDETGEFISGIERSSLLNQALMYLQPVLALGLRPDFKEGRKIYDQLVSRVTQVRGEIRTAIMVQIVPKKKKKRPGKKSDDGTGTPATPDTLDSADRDEDEALDEAEAPDKDEETGEGRATVEQSRGDD